MISRYQVGPLTARHRSAVLQLVHFTWSSGAGLAADLVVFAGLVYFGSDAFRANIASASIAITLAYFLVTRFSFRVSPTWRTYAAFILWYAMSATVVSLLIETISNGDRGTALMVKVFTVPATFVTNFLFGRWLFNGGAENLLGRAGRSIPGPVVRFASFWRSHPAALLATLATAWYQVLVVPLTSRIGFTDPSSDDVGGWARLYGLHALFIVAFWAAAWFAARFADMVKSGSTRHRFWLLSSAGVLAVNLTILLLIYPGLWIWDEFGVLGLTRVYSGYAWQGYLTHVYYTMCLYLIPSGVGVVVVQMTFASIVGGYVVTVVRDHLSRPWLAFLCALPLVSFATLANNAYPLRLTPYAYLLLLALTRLFVAWKSARPATPAALFGFGVTLAVLAFWRTEGLIFLSLLPVYAVVGGVRRTWSRNRQWTAVAAVGVLLSIAVSWQVTKRAADPHYEVTAIVNPLSTMLQQPLQSPRLSKDLAAIDRVIDVGAVRANPSYLEIPAFWLVGAKPGFETALPAARAAYLDIVLHNPGPFLQNRWSTFMATNSMQPDYLPDIHGGGVGLFSDDPSVDASFRTFVATNYLSAPLSADVRTAALKTLLLTDTKRSSPASAVVWNAAPMIATLFVVFVWGLTRRRRWMWSLLAGVVLAQATLIFLSAPGAFFMYYFPAYLIGGVVGTALLAARIDGALTARTARLIEPRPVAHERPTLEPINV